MSKERFPLQVRELRRLLLVVAGALYKRHVLVYGATCGRLRQLCDPWVDDVSKRLIVAKWANSSECCLTPGFARQLKTQGVTVEALLHDLAWRSLLIQFARVISQQVCDIEWRHGRNRARSHKSGQTRFHNFCARSMNSEAKLLHDAQGQILQAFVLDRSPTALVDECVPQVAL